MHSSSRTRLLVPVVAAVSLLLGAACSSSNSSDSSGTESTSGASSTETSTTAPGTTAAPATTVDAALSDPVGKFLISSVPEGFRLQDDTLANTGPADLGLAADEDGAPDAKAFLEGIGYQHGYRRIWATNDFGRSLYISLDLLGNESGATAYCARAAENMRGKATTTSNFTVDGHPQAIGVRASDESGSASAVFESKGAWCVEVLVAGTNDVPMADQQAQASEVFLLQYAAV